MSKQEDTLNKAYGNVPKEVQSGFSLWDDLIPFRGIRYYYLTFWRKLFR